MARTMARATQVLSQGRRSLAELANSRTASAREVERASILLGYSDGVSINAIQREVGVSRPTWIALQRAADVVLPLQAQRTAESSYGK